MPFNLLVQLIDLLIEIGYSLFLLLILSNSKSLSLLYVHFKRLDFTIQNIDFFHIVRKEEQAHVSVLLDADCIHTKLSVDYSEEVTKYSI